MSYDAANLYVAVVSDEKTAHAGAETPAAVWQGDCVQFYFLMVDPAQYKYSTHRLNYPTKMGLSASADFATQHIFRWMAAKGRGVSGMEYGNTEGLTGDDFSTIANPPKYKTLKSGSKVTYEMSIPWEILTPQGEAAPAQGGTIGLSMALLSTNHAGPESGFHSMELGQAVVDDNVLKTARLTLGTPYSDGGAVSSGAASSASAGSSSAASQNQGAASEGNSASEAAGSEPAQESGGTQSGSTQSGGSAVTEDYEIPTVAANDPRVTALLVVVIILGVLELGCAGLLAYNFLTLKKLRGGNKEG
jgi:hypothetical protein